METALAYRLNPHALQPPGHRALRRGFPAAGATHLGPRQGRHRHASCRPRRPRRFRRSSRPSPTIRSCGSRACRTHLPVADGETAGGPRLHPGTAGDVRPVGPPAAGGRVRRRHRPRRQHGRRHRLPLRPVTAWSAAASASTATCPARRCSVPSPPPPLESLRPVMCTAGPGGRRPHAAAGARPSYGRLRPLPEAFGGGHRAHRVRRRRAEQRRCSRPGSAGANRGPAPAPGGHGHHGPDRGRLRRDDDPRCSRATRSCCSGARVTRRSRPTSGPGVLGTISYEVLCGIGPRVPRLTVHRPEQAGPARPAPRRPTQRRRRPLRRISPPFGVVSGGGPPPVRSEAWLRVVRPGSTSSRDVALTCTRCPGLAQGRTQVVFGVGEPPGGSALRQEQGPGREGGSGR